MAYHTNVIGRSVPVSPLPPLPFVGDPATIAAGYFKNNLTIWNKANQPIGRLMGGGQPFTDRSGVVYAFLQNYDIVRIYAPPYTGLPTQINFGTDSIHSLAVDSKHNVFVVVTQAASDGHARYIFFRHGEVTPCNVLNGSPYLFNNLGSTFDAEGTLFFNVTSAKTGKSLVGSTAGGCGARTFQLYTFPNKIEPEVRIAFDINDNLAIQNWPGKPLKIYTYAHPKGGSFGEPISETVPRTYNGIYPEFLCLTSDGKHMWAGFLGTTLGYYNYPAGGAPILLLRDLDGINGIATLPPIIPLSR